LRPGRDLPPPRAAKRVLALRLDRLGDLVTTLPALEWLRRLLPEARIELGVGSWNEPVARRLPFVDGVRVIDVPWSAWGGDASFRKARQSLGGDGFDLAIDFQGDVRVALLMALSGAKLRAGYGDTGGDYLLTHRGRWDEKRSWYWQNLELLRAIFPAAGGKPVGAYNFVTPSDREESARLFREAGLEAPRRPLVGIQPSAGRALKEWEEEKFGRLIDELSTDATVVVTGSSADRPLVERIVGRTSSSPRALLGWPLATFAAAIESFDVFVTGDTGPMHVAHAVGTPNVAIFGPSDPVRYGPPSDVGEAGRWVVRQDLYCSPCNMIRRPPRECIAARAPECISRIGVEDVLAAVRSALSIDRPPRGMRS
jgi:ADP-heptose:LPS heptosyltransferase